MNMRLPIFVSSAVMVATAVLGINQTAYAQCQGDWCPVPNPYFNQGAPSKYGYNSPNNQNNSAAQNSNNQMYSAQNPNNPNWQGNQNPNWQGNQSPDWRNDTGWRGGNAQGYYQGSNGAYSSSNSSGYSNQAMSGNGQGYYGNVSDAGTTVPNQNAADVLLQNKVDEALKNNYLKKNYTGVKAHVFNGNVTLSGAIETEQDRQEVENRIRSLKGVQKINDQLQIGEAYGSTSSNDSSTADADTSIASSDVSVSDQDLQKAVDDTLRNNYVKKNFDNVMAKVSNGVVTITGTIENEKDRQEITQRLRKIKGISNIDDRLQIAGTNTSYNGYKKPAYAR
jgi:osmotically-inducible protein OsmY